ncbi:MAG: hypothetical protein ACOZCO_10545 [Bacteroidota bacterium]
MKSRLIKDILRDKNGFFSLRELTVAVFVIAALISWIATQFFSVPVPEFIFYAFMSIIGAGCFGYSIEKKVTPKPHEENET